MLSELRKRGVLEVHEHSEVLDASWDWEHQRWDVWLQVGLMWHCLRLTSCANALGSIMLLMSHRCAAICGRHIV